MKLVGPREKVDATLRGAVVAIGNFDGLHRGHQELLAAARELAVSRSVPFGILTFEPHPRSFFKPQEPVFRLTPPALKKRLAGHLGADFLCSLDFNAGLAAMEPADFVEHYLVQNLGVVHVVTGYDFHFGKGRKGNPDVLRSAGRVSGFGVTVVQQVTDDTGNAPFASSSIRSALRRGHVKAASRELGYDWSVMGEVVHGDKRGRTIGFPTANIILDHGAEPYRGIYAVDVRDAAAEPGTRAWMGAAYFGDRPTFSTNRTFLEVYLIDQDIDLYGRVLMVSFVDVIRGDKTFKGVDDLVSQMKLDCDEVLRVLGKREFESSTVLAKLQSEGKF